MNENGLKGTACNNELCETPKEQGLNKKSHETLKYLYELNAVLEVIENKITGCPIKQSSETGNIEDCLEELSEEMLNISSKNLGLANTIIDRL